MTDFRTEIIEGSKARTEFLKWKLIGASALGAVGLGLTEHNDPNSRAYLVLVLIPLVCFYVDLACRHITLRILVIAKFIRMMGAGEETAYEMFAQECRDVKIFRFEDAALMWSTIFLSVAVAAAGEVMWRLGIFDGSSLAILGAPLSVVIRYSFVGSGALGIVLTAWNDRSYYKKVRRLNDMAAETDRVERLKAIVAAGAPNPPPMSLA